MPPLDIDPQILRITAAASSTRVRPVDLAH